MVKDLRAKAYVPHGLCVCYLAEDCKRITSSEFKVYVPSVMGGIAQNTDEVTAKMANTNMGEDNSAFPDEVACQGYIIGHSIHPYRHRHDGWIPMFKIEQLTAETGSIENNEAEASKGVTDGVPQHPPHPISKAFKMMRAKLTSIIFNKLVATTSTEIDYQELNNKFIYRGHRMFGEFVNGLENYFVIVAIDGVVPYLTQTESSGANGDNPDTSLDGGNNPSN